MFAGGQQLGTSLLYDTVDVYNQASTKTTSPDPLSQPRKYLAATSVGNYALFAGGSDDSSPYNTVDAYDQTSTKVTPPDPLSQARVYLTATTVGNYALFAGGRNYSDFTPYDTVDVYDQTSTKVTFSDPLSQARGHLAATTVGDYALFGGGGDDSTSYYSKVDVYSPPPYNVQLFPETKYSFNGAAESTSSTWQTIAMKGSVVGYIKIKNTNITGD